MKKQFILLVFLMLVRFGFSQIPTYEFITEPIDLVENYYDYMPGSYNALPIQIEEDGSVYIVFHGRDTAASTRREYYAYIDANGNLCNIGTIGTDDIYEGFAGIDIDPNTGDPFVAWHTNCDPTTAGNELVFTYSLFHQGTPGNWTAPFALPSTNFDEIQWPEVHIGPSPDPDKRRVYIKGTFSEYLNENIVIAYADFDENDLSTQSQLDWTFRTIDQLTHWHNSTETVRPFLSCCVSDDGKLALIGYTTFENGTDSLTVLINNNFGVGDFEYYSQDAHYDVWNPFTGSTLDLYFAPFLCVHQNSVIHDNKISWLGNMNLLIDPNSWFPDLPAMYTKIYSFDADLQDFSFYDLYLEGADPADENPMIPWDLNEDGVIDSSNANGEPVYPEGWPIYFYDPAAGFHENNFKITKNEENGWLAAIWNDGLKARYAENGVAGYEDWLETPEIAICISNDNGESWSQPIFLNANETPELAEMIPEYVYPGDKIEDLGNCHGKLHFFFLDDFEYGSNFTGGMQKYCSLDIDFGDFTHSPEITVPVAKIELTNYPNPFNPSTTICFNLSKELNEQYELSIYNLKGQKVKTFSNLQINQSSNHSITWNGTDQNNKPVSSGVYFAKLKAGDQIATRKMLLMK